MNAKEFSEKTKIMPLNREDIAIILILAGLGLIILIPAAVQSTNYAYETSDDYNHYLFAVSSLGDAKFLFNGWGKPFFTLSLLIFLLATGQSLENARFLNCGIHLFSVILTYVLARRLALRRPAGFLSGILVLLAPQNLELAQSILTEPIFTFLLLLTFLAYSDRRYKVAFVLAGVSLLARSEGLFIIVILLILHYGRFKARETIRLGGVAAIPPTLISLVTTILFKQPFYAFFPPNYSKFQIYGHGQPFEYVLGTKEAIGLPTMLLALLGIALWTLQTRRSNPIIPAFLAFGIIIVVFHDLIWTFGLFGSWGTLRHLAPATPVFAYFSGYAFQQIWDYAEVKKWDFGYRLPLSATSLGFVVLCVVFWTSWYADPVITPTAEVQVSKEAVSWLKANRSDLVDNSQELYIYSPIILALLDLTYANVPKRGTALIDREILDKNLQSGGIVFWDSHHGPLEGRTPLDYFGEGFQILFTHSKEWYVGSDGNVVEFSIYIFLKI
jgi:hypothetical protein